MRDDRFLGLLARHLILTAVTLCSAGHAAGAQLTLQAEASKTQAAVYRSEITYTRLGKTPLMSISVRLGPSVSREFLFDTGASVSIIAEDVAASLGLPIKPGFALDKAPAI